MPAETLQPLQVFAEQVAAFIPRVFAALIIYVIFWFVSLGFRAAVRRYGERTRLSEEVRDLFARVTRLIILATGAITALGTIGVDVSALVAGLGLTSFALGFALQDIIANLLSGVLVLVYRPFRRGNYIIVAGKEGTVMDVDLRYTTLVKDGDRVLVPNSTLFKETIIVATAPPPPTPKEAGQLG